MTRRLKSQSKKDTNTFSFFISTDHWILNNCIPNLHNEHCFFFLADFLLVGSRQNPKLSMLVLNSIRSWSWVPYREETNLLNLYITPIWCDHVPYGLHQTSLSDRTSVGSCPANKIYNSLNMWKYNYGSLCLRHALTTCHYFGGFTFLKCLSLSQSFFFLDILKITVHSYLEIVSPTGK